MFSMIVRLQDSSTLVTPGFSAVNKFYQDGRLFFTNSQRCGKLSLFKISGTFYSHYRLTHVNLALSIARIFSKGHRARDISAAFAIIFILNLIITVTALNVSCQGGMGWKVTGKHCIKVFLLGVSWIIGMSDFTTHVGHELTSMIKSDIMLIATPLVILSHVNLPSCSKRPS
jgi:hypothetical protein